MDQLIVEKNLKGKKDYWFGDDKMP
jgi:hypothetical protein